MNGTPNDNEADSKINYLNILILFLSFYVLIALLVETFCTLPSEISRLLLFIDNIICVIFLIDFFIRFFKAEDKLKFMKWGWIDLISSIPTFEFLRPGRAFRLIRLLRILRAFRSAKVIVEHLYQKKSHGAFTTVSVLATFTLIFSSIAILQVEDHPESNIKTAEDALWWAYVTITTVGYGDRYPVTTEGRLIAVFLMTTGVGLFGTFTGFIASWFASDKGKT